MLRRPVTRGEVQWVASACSTVILRSHTFLAAESGGGMSESSPLLGPYHNMVEIVLAMQRAGHLP